VAPKVWVKICEMEGCEKGGNK